MNTPRIDSHQHFWRYSPAEYPWIKPGSPIQRSFLPEDLAPLLKRNGFDYCIAVQARQTVGETSWLLQLAAEHRFIAGVVGWVDLRSWRVWPQLREFANNPKLVGIRHVVQDEPDDEFMLRPEFMAGISYLGKFDLAYDLLVFPKQLPAAIRLAREFPRQRFILDHIAKPGIRAGAIEPWGMHVRELAQCPNVYCKISGMVTEAKWNNWTEREFRPYLDLVWQAFGEDRLMIGSDWPVCLLSADYGKAAGITLNYLKQFPEQIRARVLGGNAIRAYKLQLFDR